MNLRPLKKALLRLAFWGLVGIVLLYGPDLAETVQRLV